MGGRQTLLRIQAGTPASANASHYAQIVAELSMLRRLISTAGDIQEMATAPTRRLTKPSTGPKPQSSKSPKSALPTR
jgi:replicative DNA helicase